MKTEMTHGTGQPSPWLQRWAHLLPAGGRVLDVACGGGRHLRWLAGRSFTLTGIDRDTAALASLSDLAAAGAVELITADIENGPWPCPGRAFDAVLVSNYLWRPLWPQLLAALAPGGVLVYETFAAGNQTVGKPARPDFLLQPGELLSRCAGLRIVAYEDGFLPAPDRFVQRVVAVRETDAGGSPPRHALIAPAAA
ncbi:MAG: SAM-dependent methyltransferase [Burkholderiales bacterium RIFCSPHIGHO2_12_FULL_69_20]|nr:MAG: SAM-dependent methyltransferase [Burkholderiales bacterium RIFCSPHIGHO2_12_FULL_69_20]